MTDDIKKAVQDLKEDALQEVATQAYLGEETDPEKLQTAEELQRIQQQFSELHEGLKPTEPPRV
ncbi:MAG: hypothetical protein FJX76_12980 [Armatimonadetes bacterium]|nr:hypothetical protein [Armatimonadota bacterium]